MIKSISLCINHAVKVRKLPPDEAHVEFKPGYNALIGPNGSGKSTLLRALALCPHCAIERADSDVVKYITTETLNPNMGGAFSSWEQMIQGIRAMFLSHGQGVVDTLLNQSHGNETVVMIDSPETGQDLDNSEYIYRGLLKMAERYQVIVATNSLLFMRSGNLIDLGEQSLSRLIEATKRLAAGFDVT